MINLSLIILMYIIAVRVHSSIFISVLTCAMNSPKYLNTLKIYIRVYQPSARAVPGDCRPDFWTINRPSASRSTKRPLPRSDIHEEQSPASLLNKLEIYCKTEKSQVHGPDRFRKLPTCDHKFAAKRNTWSQVRKLQVSAYSERLLTSETQYVEFAMKSSSCETYRKEVKWPRTLKSSSFNFIPTLQIFTEK